MISIVIPAYNAAATVGRCLDSLLAQTYRDFELIVVTMVQRTVRHRLFPPMRSVTAGSA